MLHLVFRFSSRICVVISLKTFLLSPPKVLYQTGKLESYIDFESSLSISWDSTSSLSTGAVLFLALLSVSCSSILDTFLVCGSLVIESPTEFKLIEGAKEGKIFLENSASDLPVKMGMLERQFDVAVPLFSNRSQMPSKCGKNKKVAHDPLEEFHFLKKQSE